MKINIGKFILNAKSLLLCVNYPDNFKNFLQFPSNTFTRLYENFHPTCLFGLHIYLSFGNFSSSTLIWTTLLLGTLEYDDWCTSIGHIYWIYTQKILILICALKFEFLTWPLISKAFRNPFSSLKVTSLNKKELLKWLSDVVKMFQESFQKTVLGHLI